MPTGLTDLPPELLNQVIANIETAQDLCHLSLACKHTRDIVRKDGFRTFASSHFPCASFFNPNCASNDSHDSQFWRDSVHALTALSQNWNRRAMIARVIRHPKNAKTHSRRRQPGTQTMGWVPVLDSYQTWTGGSWTSRKDVVAWGAGTRLLMRSKSLNRAEQLVNLDEGAISDSEQTLQEPPLVVDRDWRFYEPKGLVQGMDDIITLNLLPQPEGTAEQCIIGRASGSLARISLNAGSVGRHLTSYDTSNRPVKSSAMSAAKSLLATCLSDKTINLYDPQSEDDWAIPLAETFLPTENDQVRTWTCCFLDKQRVAVGLGRSHRPVQLFDVGQGELRLGRSIDFIGSVLMDDYKGSSVYAIAPLPHSSANDDSPGDLFLTGAYDGYIRFHDLRCRSTVVSLFADPIDGDSHIYSLLPIGQERFIAGGARDSVAKVFDLRIPGEKRYSPPSLRQNRQNIAESPPFLSPNYNLFLYGERDGSKSPVYCLSRPSSIAPTFYAGFEDRILQVDLRSILDPHPDPFQARNGLVPESTAILPPLPSRRRSKMPVDYSNSFLSSSLSPSSSSSTSSEQMQALSLISHRDSKSRSDQEVQWDGFEAWETERHLHGTLALLRMYDHPPRYFRNSGEHSMWEQEGFLGAWYRSQRTQVRARARAEWGKQGFSVKKIRELEFERRAASYKDGWRGWESELRDREQIEDYEDYAGLDEQWRMIV